MAAGHDEYWTKTMRDAWEAARDAGVNLAFMGANDSYWQVGYEDGGRTLVGYKASPDPDPEPGQKTTQFRQMSPARPECELFGVQLQDDVLYHRNLDLVADSAVPRDPWFAGSGLSTGSVLSGLGGSETDAVMPGCHVPPVTRLFSASGPPLPNGTPVRQDTVRYTACSGAEVFSAGSLQFAWGLDDWRDAIYTGPGLPAVPPADPRLQAAMTRALADLVRSHVPSRGPPQVCVPSAGILATARWAAVGQQLNFSTAATDPYGQIASQRWTISLPGSSATTDQSGVEGPTVTTTAHRSGTARINLTAADRSGATAKKLLKLQMCPCPWRGWPAPTEQGLPCRLMDIGALRQIRHSLWFVPNAPAADLRLTTYLMGVRGRRIRLTHVGTTTAAYTSTPIRIRTGGGPTEVDVSSFVAGHRWHQRFVLGPASARGRPSAGLQVATTCDGVSAQILTPIFGAGRQIPLRVGVSGRGRIVVSLIGPSGASLTRRIVVMRRRTQTIAFAPPRLSHGAYTVTVSAWRSRLPQPIRLTALLL